MRERLTFHFELKTRSGNFRFFFLFFFSPFFLFFQIKARSRLVTVANKAIKRKRYPTPTLNELKTILSGVNVFSKLDLNQGYNQSELAEESRYITTFATYLGLYRYKRLFLVSTPPVRYSRKKSVKHLQGLREPSTSATTSFALDQTSKTTTKTSMRYSDDFAKKDSP